MHEGTVDTPLDTHPWLTLDEVARVLGVSEKTARRRAKAGQLEARQIPTQHGPAWQVRLPNGIPTVARVDSTVPRTAPDLAALAALVDRLQAENRQLAEAAAVWQERARVLGEQFALSAPQPPVEASTAPDPPDPPTAGPVPWWRRWRAWLAAGLVVVVVGSASCGSGRPVYRALCAEASEFLHASDYEVTNARMRGDDTGLGAGNSANWEAISLRANVQVAAC